MTPNEHFTSTERRSLSQRIEWLHRKLALWSVRDNGYMTTAERLIKAAKNAEYAVQQFALAYWDALPDKERGELLDKGRMRAEERARANAARDLLAWHRTAPLSHDEGRAMTEWTNEAEEQFADLIERLRRVTAQATAGKPPDPDLCRVAALRFPGEADAVAKWTEWANDILLDGLMRAIRERAEYLAAEDATVIGGMVQIEHTHIAATQVMCRLQLSIGTLES